MSGVGPGRGNRGVVATDVKERELRKWHLSALYIRKRSSLMNQSKVTNF
jgi:hypothetical protein